MVKVELVDEIIAQIQNLLIVLHLQPYNQPHSVKYWPEVVVICDFIPCMVK